MWFLKLAYQERKGLGIESIGYKYAIIILVVTFILRFEYINIQYWISQWHGSLILISIEICTWKPNYHTPKKLHQSPKKDAEFHNVDLITKDAWGPPAESTRQVGRRAELSTVHPTVVAAGTPGRVESSNYPCRQSAGLELSFHHPGILCNWSCSSSDFSD